MKKLCILITASLSFSFSVFGQGNSEGSKSTVPSITRPSPTVAQLMKVEESTLDHYTGQPQISVPLFSKKAGNLDVNLALYYNSSGIRVTEQSGWTGKGWTLDTGGVIARNVVDLPDEIDTDNYRGSNVNGLHDFFSYGEDSDQRRGFAYDAQWGTRVRLDSKTDIYQFSFFGRTGRFAFVKTGNELKPAIIGNDGNYKIEANYITRTLPTMYKKEIISFTITDGMGYRYHFTEIERTAKRDISFAYMQEGCDSPVAPNEAPTIQKFISAWHLSKVEDANGIRLLDIAYADVVEKPQPSESRTDYVAENLGSIFLGDSEDCTKHMRCALEPRTTTSKSYRDIDTKKISSISFPDGSSIQFSISASHPEYRDGKGAYLTGIKIYNGFEPVPVRSFDLAYSTSAGPSLFLDSVKTNNSDIDKYSFEYYKREEYRGFDTEERDIFGYADFEPANDDMKTGVLAKITYPTKGVREFAWEPNTYSYKGDRLLTFQEIFENPDNYTADPVGVSDTYINEGNGLPRPYSIIHINLEQNASTIAETYANGTIDPMMPNSVKIVPIMSPTDHTVDPSRPDLSFPINTGQYIKRTLHLKPGAYKVSFWSINLSDDHVKIGGYLQIMAKTPKRHLNWFLYGGGIRIKTAKDSDRNIDQAVKGYAYNFENPGIIPTDLPPYPFLGEGGSYTIDFSSGSFDGSDNLVRDYWADITPIFNLPPYYIRPVTSVQYHVYEKQSELDAQLQKGSFIGYKNVFEYVYPSNGPAMLYKSKIRYVFDSPIDFPSLITISSPPLPIRGDEYKQSNVRKIEYFGSGTGMVVSEDFKYNYDAGSIKTPVKKDLYFITNAGSISGDCQQIREIFPTYATVQSGFVSSGGYERDCAGEESSLIMGFQNMDRSQCIDRLSENYMAIEDYRYKPQMVEQTKKEYFPAGPIETKETFSYTNGFRQLSRQASLTSTGQTLETRYYYPQDTEMAPATTPYKAELVTRNMTDTPLRTENYRNGGMVSVQETRYGMFSLPADTNVPAAPAIGNALLPQHIYAGKISAADMEKKITFDSYDSRSNITQYTQDGGVPVSFIWGYRKSEPVAKIENMAYSAIPSALVTDLQAASDAIPYNETLLALKMKAVRTDAALSNAMVTAYSYKPLVGTVTETDPKGSTTAYSYDAFGRLETVKDREGKLLSKNEYQYRTQN